MPAPADTSFTVPSLNLEVVERMITVEALERAGTIHGAAALLGTTRHGLKRRIIKHRIQWPRNTCSAPADAGSQPASACEGGDRG